MIEFYDVTVMFGGGPPALESVSLRVAAGEFAFVVGPTGAGKSTLLRLIYRDVLPTRGCVRVLGRDMAQMSPREVPHLRRHIGVVFQDASLLPRKTVWENVAFALQVIGASRATILREVPRALSVVGLSDKAYAYPETLSGGEQQRACIARAIVNHPSIVVADEPTGNLDPATSWDVMQVLRHVNAHGTTVVVATHDREVVDRMRKRVIVLDKGRVARDAEDSDYEGVAASSGVFLEGDLH
ncbi:MAG: cell division ATP-binding protein FtsE [Abditibacteriales bacterium]|nr:cell division ATP-binding protein FtsE [Abditibacteriales bacterium]MDW8365925.1 cell division ATP-binding protein FtsE [Abditibacteriales bacterium]